MTRSFACRPKSLFVSPSNTRRSISKNAVSYCIRDVITEATVGVGRGVPRGARAHPVRAISTSAAFMQNYSIQSILEAATWSSPLVFTSFYLRDIQFTHGDGFGLGPFVAAGTALGHAN